MTEPIRGLNPIIDPMYRYQMDIYGDQKRADKDKYHKSGSDSS